MAQNTFAAGHHRGPSTAGIHMDRPDYVLPEPPPRDKHGQKQSNKVFQVVKRT